MSQRGTDGGAVNQFETTAEAFRSARARAAIAAYIEADVLHTAIRDAREAGMSVRETATVLEVPKSTVARHWHAGIGGVAPPVWGDADLYVEAERAIWHHAPEQANGQAPFEWTSDPDGSRRVRAVPISPAVASQRHELRD
jgi:hypothetical protein